MQMILGLTGGIACGKSTVADFFGKMIPVVATDKIGHEMLLKGSPAHPDLLRAFGAGILDGEGHVSREKLAGLVFQDDSKRKTLEGIVHPLIRLEWKKRVHELQNRMSHSQSMVIVEIPLLFEANAEEEFDRIVCVASSQQTQINRLMKTRGLVPEEAEKRIRSQMSVAEKMDRSDFVVWNEFHLSHLQRQVSLLMEKFRLSAGHELK
ncbi:dephospho-CoA kinase [Kamptonema cortianum]|nr:dephospho-CoA kinase [Kamptonema cortianum]MDL5049721.1 dephospho-CoA kinase [Oscillatoria amoena NRMC-F 0135]